MDGRDDVDPAFLNESANHLAWYGNGVTKTPQGTRKEIKTDVGTHLSLVQPSSPNVQVSPGLSDRAEIPPRIRIAIDQPLYLLANPLEQEQDDPEQFELN